MSSPAVLAGTAVGAASLALYLLTLAPSLTWGWNGKGADGGELLAAANTLGIPHPPGYPTYTLLLKAFATVVPVGDFAFRGNLLSAVLAAGSIVTIYWTVLRLCRSIKSEAPEALAIAAAVLGSAVFATSPLFWSQATITEVYTLNALFAGVLLLLASYLAIGAPRRGAGRRAATNSKLALFGLVLGVGLGNHLTLLAVAIPLLYWVWSVRGAKAVASPWIIVAFLFGISIYVYLPLRAAHHPPINWGAADTLDGLVWMLTARPYQEYAFGVTAGTYLARLVSWIELVFSQFNPLGLFLGLMAIGPLRRLAPQFYIATLGSMAVISAYAVTYNTVDFEVLMAPAFLLFSVWVGTGFYWIAATWIRDFAQGTGPLSEWRARVQASHQVLVLSVLAFLLLPTTAVALNYGSQNLMGDYTARDYGREVIGQVPDGSVLLGHSEKDVFSLWYMRYVERPERDVAVIAVPLLQFDWYLRDIHRLYPQRVPRLSVTDTLEVIARIVQHNQNGPGVFLTFTSPSLTESINLTRSGKVYEATVVE